MDKQHGWESRKGRREAERECVHVRANNILSIFDKPGVSQSDFFEEANTHGHMHLFDKYFENI